MGKALEDKSLEAIKSIEFETKRAVSGWIKIEGKKCYFKRSNLKKNQSPELTIYQPIGFSGTANVNECIKEAIIYLRKDKLI